VHAYIQRILENVKAQNSDQPEFIQAVEEVLSTLSPVIEDHPEYEQDAVLERLVEPERTVMFRVPWMDDTGAIRINRGYRVQFNSAIGPYKGGLRFDPTVNLSVLKFLGSEQIFKNSLTTLPLGGGKGGSDFNPKQSPHTPGKRCSDREVMRFCQSFMMELYRHVGANTDVPAGDMNVGGREIGYLFGAYRRITNEWSGVLTGKALSFGGSMIRPEATGYGAMYFAEEMLKTKKDGLGGKTCLLSGAGNVATYAMEKLLQLGAKPVTLSDRSGTLYVPDGYTMDDMHLVMRHKEVERGELSELAAQIPGAQFFAKAKPWQIVDKVDCAFPCSRQNELDDQDAMYLLRHGCKVVAEGANMPSTPLAVKAFQKSGILYAPGKAANAGGVATSGLEMTQNSERLYWTAEKVDAKLRGIMEAIHHNAFEAAARYGHPGDYVMGANIAGFTKVADAMIAQGV